MSLRTGLPLLAAVLATAAASPAQISFNRDIRPLMADTCFRCHGPDRNARMAGMRLDIRDEALKPTASGAVPIVPGDPERSAIVQRIFAKDALLMPPAFAHKELTETQKDTIRRWVAEGAKYEGHWAYLPVQRPTPPAGQRHPLDAFIQARLAREGLQPAPEADRRTLIRRVTLDLTGLPPASRDVEAFVNDKSPGAYEKLVDRLLASPRYAEKQAMHWLDAVRYADTSGFHSDLPYPIWPYRDYVLRAFRDNKPFDVFTREQLAGDLMPNATTEQKVASAYNRLSRMSPEGGLQPKEYLAKYAADRVRTTSTVWLGSTLGCAECHDHKFDPFLSKDFYSMKAFFADILETGRSPDRGPTAWGTKLDLPTEEQQRRREQLNWRLTEARRLREQDARALNENEAAAWEAEVLRRYEAGELNWRYQRPLSAESANGARLTVYNDEPVESNYYLGGTLIAERAPGNGLVVATGPNPDNETYTVTLRPGEGTWTALGLEVVHDENLPSHRLARGADRLVVTEVEADVSSDGRSAPRRLPFVLASASVAVEPPELHPMAVIDGDPKTGWGVASSGDYGNLFLALRFAQELHTDAGSILTVRIKHDSEFRRAVMGRFRLTLSSGVHSWPEPENLRARLRRDTNLPAPDKDKHGVPNAVLTALHTPEDKRTDEHRRTLLDYYQWLAPGLQARTTEIAKLEAALGQLDAEIPKVVVSQATRPAVTRILPRSNWMDETGEIVQPAIPVFLGKLANDGRATRLDLANWLVSPDNPLTARVFVNRLWREFFGAGLVKTLDDLGSQGDWPAYPEVLDWLAAEFMQPAWQATGTHPWDIRHAIRTIVTSRAYRQSSLGTPELNERDPDNRLLARQSRFRVDAEVVHDIALDVSGLLVEKFGGPSVRPYQPDGYLAALNFPKREWAASRGEDLYRRAVYMFWQRTFLHPTLMNFDASTREECAVNRVNSNTPLQALDLLNDPIYVEAARVFAQNILKDGGRSVADRLDWAFARAASRKPAEEERRTLAGLYRESLKRFQAAPADAQQLIHVGEAPLLSTADPAELAALTTVARAILNLHETIARD
jgi:hypothetical protein